MINSLHISHLAKYVPELLDRLSMRVSMLEAAERYPADYEVIVVHPDDHDSEHYYYLRPRSSGPSTLQYAEGIDFDQFVDFTNNSRMKFTSITEEQQVLLLGVDSI